MMHLPEGVNPITFYSEAKQKGIKITSRFPGVVFNLNGKKPCWLVRYQGGKEFFFLGRFPFTIVGERSAARKYTNHLESLGKEKRYSGKRKYNNQTHPAGGE